MRFLVLGLFLAATAPALAGDSGRYAFVPSESGVFRLDTESGEVSLCMERGGTLVCLRGPGQASGALAHEADRIAALEARIAALEAGEGQTAPTRGDDAMRRIKHLAERMMDRVVALVREMKGAPPRETL
jgi:hypothetical protein